MNLSGNRMVAMDWTHLTQNREKWRAVVIVVMKHKVPQNMEDFMTVVGKDGSASWSQSVC
jgi:hypothetical protein